MHTYTMHTFRQNFSIYHLTRLAYIIFLYTIFLLTFCLLLCSLVNKLISLTFHRGIHKQAQRERPDTSSISSKNPLFTQAGAMKHNAQDYIVN